MMPIKLWGRTEADKAADNKATIDKRTERLKLVERALRVKSFMAGDFWRSVMLPYLESEIEKARDGAIWKPGRTTDRNAIGDQNLVNGGMIVALEKIESDLILWIKQGEEAGMALRAEEKQ